MKLTNNEAHRLLGALRGIDAAETVKLPGQIRIDIARNISRLFPDVEAFEKALSSKRREIVPGPDHAAENARIITEIEEMGSAEIDVKLFKLDHASLRLDDNPRITGDMVAALSPILKDFDTLEGGE